MFRRIANLIKGFLSLFISGLEKANPEALLEAEKENLRSQIAQFNQGLASHAALCERLMSQVRQQEDEQKQLRAKTAANLKAGNRDVAGQYALRLQTVESNLVENRKQLEQAETTYHDLVNARDVSIRAAQAKIESLRAGLNDLKVKRAMAELNEMASGMVSSIGGSGDTLNRMETMVREERDKAAGRARVAKDSMDLSEIKMKEGEQKALADRPSPASPRRKASSSSPTSPRPKPPRRAPPRRWAPPPPKRTRRNKKR
ncbi:PspA/IM30 family protein [bacterium]|nr:PspA/IM30 family protein [bacterium]